MVEHVMGETTVVVTGALAGPAVARWSRLIRDAAAVQPRRLVVDLTGCSQIDAEAIVVLLQVHRAMIRADGQLTLRRPVPRVRRMLSLARVDHVLDVDESAQLPVGDPSGGAVVTGSLTGPRVPPTTNGRNHDDVAHAG